MEIIIQNISKIPIQKETVYVDTERHSILFWQAYQPVSNHRIKDKLYVYVDFDFHVTIQDNDYWIVPKNMSY